MQGRAVDDLVARSAALPPGTLSLYDSAVDRPAGVRLAFRGELAQSREVFRGLLAAADERGEARSGIVFTGQLCEVELRAGHASAAARLLAELEQWAALEPHRGFQTRIRAVLAAVRGDSGRAAEAAAEVLRGSESTRPCP